MNDPLRVAREGPFWASMFVVLGAVVGFGGTIEVRIYFLSGRLRYMLRAISIPQMRSIPYTYEVYRQFTFEEMPCF